jgi:methionyl-tRNA synthetase
MTNKDKIVVTAALPYANGNIHIGHLLEYIQTDIFVRLLKLLKEDALYICASDMHGTPVEIKAKEVGKDPEKFALEFWKEHQKDFTNYLIKFDNYYKTHSPENKEIAEHFFSELKKKDLIYTKEMDIIYCESCQRSLPDRYVKGTCPHCTTLDQYGDICESCSSVLKGVDLINPKCTLCGKTPIQKKSTHYFFKLSKFSTKLKKWINDKDSGLQSEVKNWLTNWIEKGLEDWCVSRDEPYFGFEIPGSKKELGEKKYFYVWLDAPIGYISSTKNYCEKNNCQWEDYWKNGKVYHFIGKDISYFHFLFWPAMLMAVDIPLPKLTVHGFITVNGQKMSKSRGTFFTAKEFLKLYPAESLRFYYASHLDRKVVDIDLSFEDFKAVINNVLVGNLGNFCYRVLTFAKKNYSEIKEIAEEKVLVKQIDTLTEKVKEYYLSQNFKLAVKHILQIADLGNAYFQKSEVWKDKESSEDKVGFCVNLARNLTILINPILPEFSKKVYTALNEKELLWEDLGYQWKGKLKEIEKLVEKVDMIPESAKFPLQLVVGEIKEVKDHPNAEKLYLLKVNFGSEERQIVSGLKDYFKPEELLNKKRVFCLNLKPAKLRGEISKGMILAAEDEEGLALLDVEKTKPGEEVKFEGLDNNVKEITYNDFKKVKLVVKKGKVIYDNKTLVGNVEEVKVIGVKDGAVIE